MTQGEAKYVHQHCQDTRQTQPKVLTSNQNLFLLENNNNANTTTTTNNNTNNNNKFK